MDYYAQQAFQMRNVPGLSIADNNFIATWEARARAADEQRVRSEIRDSRARDQQKAKDVLARLDGLQERLVAVRKQAERNEVPWKDLAKLQKRLINERITLEKVLESLQSVEAKRQAMDEDPVGYLTEFYSRFPTLNDRRPSLAVDLAEDQRKRGAAALM
ncbi:hypothetical protein [Nocardioides sp. zg-1230]|uniref:hypothetical protein n=1 Tax=Nocardioides sp. zg-1230 TaxID=2736601 RepID=UPI001552F84D|nr:hypothetical protein [Nocardioides sp. zg-1230]NPC43128.1 hypothetical protein [Nocardioides sp. zg-1230]